MDSFPPPNDFSTTSSSSLLLEDALIVPHFNFGQFLETYIVDYFSPFLAPLYVYLRGWIAAKNGYHVYNTWIEWFTVPIIFLILGWTSKSAIILWIIMKNRQSDLGGGDLVLDSISHEVMTLLLLDFFWRSISPLHFGFLTPKEFSKYLSIPNTTIGNHGFTLWLHGATSEIYSLEVKRSAARCTLRLNECLFELSGAHLAKLLERLGDGAARDILWQGVTLIRKGNVGNGNSMDDHVGNGNTSQSAEQLFSSLSSSSSMSPSVVTSQSAEQLFSSLSSSSSMSPTVGINVTPSTEGKQSAIFPTPSVYPSIRPSDIYHVSVQSVCVSILLYTKRFSFSSSKHIPWLWSSRIIVAAAMSISPIVSRAAIGLPSIGSSLTTQFIIITCCVFNFLYSFVTATFIIGGVEDFSRRSISLRLLGELVERCHYLPETEVHANTVAESILTNEIVAHFRATRDSGGSGSNSILPLESAGNVAAWLASRRVLKGVGLQYVLQFGIYTIAAVFFSIAQFAVTLIVVLITSDSPPGSNSSSTLESKKPIPATSQGLLLLVLYVGLLLFVIREGSIANKTASAHKELAVSLRAEAARRSAQLRSKSNERRRSGQQTDKERELVDHECDHWDDVARMLEVVPNSLDCERKLKVLGFDATDTLFNSCLSAIASGIGLVLGLLQYRFGSLY